MGCLMLGFLIVGCFNPDNSVNSSNSENKNLPVGLLTSPVGSNFFKLSKIYRFQNSADHRASPAPTVTNFTRQGLGWYVIEPSEADLQGSLRYEIFRYWDGKGDYMSSYTQNEGGYGSASVLGKFFTSGSLSINGVAITPQPLQSIPRYVRNWTTGTWPTTKYHSDHLTAVPGENPSGYTSDGALGFGFPRYTYDLQNGTAGPPIDRTISANNVTIGFIKSWGGSISSLSFDNVEYINRQEAGRLLGFAANHVWPSEQYNPTEAGDWQGNGSPVMYYNTVPENTTNPNRFATRTMPLLFVNPNGTVANNFRDGLPADGRHLLLYGGTMAKDVEIQGDRAVSGGSVKVIKSDFSFTPAESRNWGMIHIATHLNYAGLMADPAASSTGGWHFLYRRAGNLGPGNAFSLQQTNWGSNSFIVDYPNPDGVFWGQPWTTTAAGVSTLSIAEGNGTGRAFGILRKDSPVVFAANGTSTNRALQTSHTSVRQYSPSNPLTSNSPNTHAIHTEFRDVALNSGETFWVRIYFLLGTRSQILEAARNLP